MRSLSPTAFCAHPTIVAPTAEDHSLVMAQTRSFIHSVSRVFGSGLLFVVLASKERSAGQRMQQLQAGPLPVRLVSVGFSLQRLPSLMQLKRYRRSPTKQISPSMCLCVGIHTYSCDRQQQLPTPDSFASPTCAADRGDSQKTKSKDIVVAHSAGVGKAAC